MFIIGVFGNRDITDASLIRKKFDEYMKNTSFEEVLILHGGAAGPQEVLAEDYISILFKPWHMIWSKIEFAPILFYMRNKQIVENSDEVIIFSNGEKDAEVYKVIDLCKRKRVKYTIIDV